MAYSIVLENPPEDLGVKLYGFGKSVKKSNNKKAGERKKTWRSPVAIYLYIISAFLVFWFLYTVIDDVLCGGAKTLLSHIVDFIVLAVCILIVFLSMFKLWDKFLRFVLRHKLVRNNERAGVEDSAEMMENYYDKLDYPDPQPVFEVYENYIRVTDGAEVKVLRRSSVSKITAYETGKECTFSILAYTLECVTCTGLRLPIRELKKLKEIFGAKLHIQSLYGSEDKKSRAKERRSDFRKNLDITHMGGLCMGIVAVLAGCAVIGLHYAPDSTIPAEGGVIFIGIGLIVMCTAFSFVPIVLVFIIPLLFGCMFVVFPVVLCLLISNTTGVPLPFASLHEFLTSFSVLYCASAFFMAMGGVFVVGAFVRLIKYIKYGEVSFN
ncbi:MAG: hypothetical protein K2O89_06590 [Clostridia bacterium]|nr:hypothetical protein [Clostridia bacterium]